ncbi:MAG: DUF262 domain-containing protein [Oscillatoriales cyanobacterium]|uniref:DUF262 domain-containing protein n=1 Tax=Microcoleus anatoxicus TaxID=2705319 RepID=UPI0029726AF0|nr:MAG: DUF262 domain-containing protein [Oscillatoriales cyanobacterium]TAE02089.1 MAG: DUF262 domain-containing protein [Oscillatoriales cyanobacterium]TAF05227.1 MAG: DUF262 domain-containing protein [Oscillatoriales cyanobacterium]TAF42961.1 MAG: DUF262 domain-containing protein [Oscillatoriales cyanobacterium]TAF63022.1 MAG: DUF262 domain-containing protein [Oscillatoriales cyanobacterium]
MSDENQSKFTDEEVATAEQQIFEHTKRIEFYLTEYSIELLAQKMQNGDFEIPAYQREFTWEPERKSRFIESVLMGLPIPFLFFWESPSTGKLEIVDGSQRLRTIQEFVLGDFPLGDLEELSLLTGFRFKDLPESRQRKIKNRSIRGIVLNEHADEQARFDLFDRINTGSKVANKAEVRRGALGGAFLDLVISLAKEPSFVKLAPISDKLLLEREREELVTRFFAYGDGLEGYKDRVSAFLFTYTKNMNDRFKDNPADIESYRQRFMDMIDFVSRNFPSGFRKTPKGKATPRSRFEAIAIGSYMALQERPEIANQSIEVEEWLNSKEFTKVTGADGANAIGRLKARIHFVRDRLLGD